MCVRKILDRIGFILAMLFIAIGLTASEAFGVGLSGPMIKSLLSSKLTHIDFDQDGKADLIRSFNPKTGKIQSLDIIRSRKPLTEVKITMDYFSHSTYKKTYKETKKAGYLLIKDETFKRDQFNRLLRWTSIEDINADGVMDIKDEKKFDTLIVFHHRYESIAGEWKETYTRQSSALLQAGFVLTGNEEVERDQLVARVSQEYVDCLEGQPEFTGRDCSNVITAEFMRDFGELSQNFSELVCRSGTDLHVPGFRIDTNSCHDPRLIAGLQDVMDNVINEKFACLSSISPQFFEDCLSNALLTTKPRVRCAYGMGGPSSSEDRQTIANSPECNTEVEETRTWLTELAEDELAVTLADAGASTIEDFLGQQREACAEGVILRRNRDSYTDENCRNVLPKDRTACAKEFLSYRKSTEGFFWEGSPGDFFLTSEDPMRSPNKFFDENGELNLQKKNELSKLIFHEVLHACGHSGGEGHHHGRYDDDVYGCEALCSGERNKLSREGCQACLNPAQNESNNTAENLDFCNQFPRERVQYSLTIAKTLSEFVNYCQKSSPSSCLQKLQKMRDFPVYADICSNLPTKIQSGEMVVTAAEETDESRRAQAEADLRHNTVLRDRHTGPCLRNMKARIRDLLFTASLASENQEIFDYAVESMGGDEASRGFRVSRNSNGRLIYQPSELRNPFNEGLGPIRDAFIGSFCDSIATVTDDNFHTVKLTYEQSGRHLRFSHGNAADTPLPLFDQDYAPASNRTEALQRCQRFQYNGGSMTASSSD